MTFPKTLLPLTVEVFIDGTWQDLSDRLLDQTLSPSHGRSDEVSQAAPATVTVALKNEDGLLTPGDPRSAWWPQWGQGTPLRLRVGDILGQQLEVSEIAPDWPVGDLSNVDPDDLADLTTIPKARLGVARVNVTAAGILRRLGQGAKALRSPLYRKVMPASTVAYWPMEDGSNTKEATSATGGPSMAVGGLTMGSSSVVLGSDPLPQASQPATWLGRVQGMDAGPWVYGQALSIPQGPDANTTIGRLFDLSIRGSEIVRWRVDLGFSGSQPTLRLVGSDSSGLAAVDQTVTSPPLFFGEPLILTLTRGDEDYTLSWRRNGVSTVLVSGSYGSRAGLVRSVAGQVAGITVSFGHILIVAADEEPDDWLDDAFVGHQGEPAGQRFLRLCAEEGEAGTVDGDPAETTPMGPQQSKTLLDLLDECRLSDLAILAEVRSGDPALLFRTRRSRYNRPVALTLDASQSQIALPFAPVADDQGIVNDVTVQRAGGGSRQRVDTVDSSAPPVGRGHFTDSPTLSLASDGLLDDQAGWRLHMGTWKGWRYPQVTIDFAVAPDLIESFLELVDGDRIQIINLPPQHLLSTVDLIVQGWSGNRSPTAWTETLNCTPAGPWTVAVWGVSRYGLKTQALASAVNDAATSLSVAFTDEPLTTAVPFDCMLGPEQVTVTAVAGSSSPQAVTVVRNVNGMARAHAAGTRLELAQQPVLAL